MKDRPSVMAHINMMQGLINRMASNSANSKAIMVYNNFGGNFCFVL